MLGHPVFNPHFHVEIVVGQGVFLFGETERFVLEGALYEWVSALMDGRSADAIADALAHTHRGAEVYFALMRLEALGHVVEQPQNTRLAAFFSARGLVPAEAEARLAMRRVAIRTLGALSDTHLREALAVHGVTIGEPADLVVVWAEDYLHEEMEAINREYREAGQAWMLVKPTGRAHLRGRRGGLLGLPGARPAPAPAGRDLPDGKGGAHLARAGWSCGQPNGRRDGRGVRRR